MPSGCVCDANLDCTTADWRYMLWGMIRAPTVPTARGKAAFGSRGRTKPAHATHTIAAQWSKTSGQKCVLTRWRKRIASQAFSGVLDPHCWQLHVLTHAGQSRAGQGKEEARAQEGRAGQSRAEQGRARQQQSRAEQGE